VGINRVFFSRGGRTNVSKSVVTLTPRERHYATQVSNGGASNSVVVPMLCGKESGVCIDATTLIHPLPMAPSCFNCSSRSLSIQRLLLR
jgi:hypothetical protein